MRLRQALQKCYGVLLLPLQIFDGKDGRAKYPKRWIMLPPFF